MRRLSTLVIIALMLAAGLGAQGNTAALNFKLLEAGEYEMDMFYSTELQRLYVQLDFDIPKIQLDPAYSYGVFLDKNAQFQGLTVSGYYEEHYWLRNLAPQHFVPELGKPELLAEDSSVRFIGLTLDNYNRLPETVHFRIWYYTNVPPFRIDEMNKLSTGLDASLYWYPRNNSRDSTVNLTLTTTPYMTLLVGNNYATNIDMEYSRIHKSNFIERAAQPSAFRLIRD